MSAFEIGFKPVLRLLVGYLLPRHVIYYVYIIGE